MVIHAPPLVDAIGEPIETSTTPLPDATKPVVAVMLGAGNGRCVLARRSRRSPSPSRRRRARPDRRLLGVAPERPRQPAELDPIAGHIDVASAAGVIAAHIGKDDPRRRSSPPCSGATA